MQKFKYKLSHLMDGRNGLDNLGKVIFIGGLILYAIALFTRLSVLQFISLFLLIYEIYRTFSKDIYNRQEENKKYLGFLKLNKMRFEQRGEYRVYRCAGCGKIIRVPKGKGKVEVRCPVCGYKKIHHT